MNFLGIILPVIGIFTGIVGAFLVPNDVRVWPIAVSLWALGSLFKEFEVQALRRRIK